MSRWHLIVSWWKNICPVCGADRWYLDGGWCGFEFCRTCGRSTLDGWNEVHEHLKK